MKPVIVSSEGGGDKTLFISPYTRVFAGVSKGPSTAWGIRRRSHDISYKSIDINIYGYIPMYALIEEPAGYLGFLSK